MIKLIVNFVDVTQPTLQYVSITVDFYCSEIVMIYGVAVLARNIRLTRDDTRDI